MIVSTLQVNWKVERAALFFIFLIAALATAATITRFAVQVALNKDNIAQKGAQEMLIRLEVIFATAAYGLAFPRAWLRLFVRKLKKVMGKAKEVTLASGRIERGASGEDDTGYILESVSRLPSSATEERKGIAR